MGSQRVRQGLTHFVVAEGVEVPTIEAEGPLIGAWTTASTKIEDGHIMGLRPGLSLRESWPIGRRSVHQIAMEREEANGDASAPPRGHRLHVLEDAASLSVRDPRNPRLLGGPVRQKLGLMSERVQVLSEHGIEANVSNEEGSEARSEALGSEIALGVRHQRPVEVVHGDKHHREVGLILRDRTLKEPARHRGGVSRLARVDHADVGPLQSLQGALGEGRDALGVLDAPAEHGRVSHHSHAPLARFGRDGVGGAKSVSVGGDAELVGLAQAGHGVAGEVGLGLPASHRVRLVRGHDSREPRANLSQAQQGGREGEPQHKARAQRWSSSLHWRQLIRVCVLFCAWSLSAQAEVRLTLAVSVEEGALTSEAPGAVSAQVLWMGEEREVPLRQEEPGLWTATVSGPQTRTVGVDLWLTDRDPPLRVSQGLEILPEGDARLSWALSARASDSAWRLSEPVQFSTLRAQQERRSMAWGVWLVVSVLGVLLLGQRALGRSAREWVERPLPGALAGLLWLTFGVVWTWPSAVAGANIVGRHFDALGTVWVIDAAYRMGLQLHDAFSAWPDGVTYSAIDSWLLLPLAWASGELEPARLHGWLAVLGVALSGWSAAAFARVVGVRAPFHHLAGFLFVGSGLAAAALLEGHVYQVMNPWMPLMALSLWRCREGEATWTDGLWAGVFFGLALFSSGYLGVSAGLVAAGIGLSGMSRGASRLPLLLAATIALSFGLVYLHLFSSAGTPGASYASTETLRLGSLSLGSLGPASAEVDRTDHSWSLALSAGSVALAVFALSLRGRMLAPLAVVWCLAVLISLGPDWSLGIAPDESSMASPLHALWEIPWVRYLRFPGRIMWAGGLCLSVMAALGVSLLRERLGSRLSRVLVALIALETVYAVRLPLRQVARPSTTPSVYRIAEGAVFDLVGEGTSRSREVDSWMNAMLCQYQTQHKRPIAEDCVAVGPEANPRVPRARQVAARLFEGDREGAFALLRGWGFSALAVHNDWIDPADGLRIREALKGFSTHTERDRGGGVVLVKVPASGAQGGVRTERARRLVGPPVKPIQWNLRVDLMLPDGFDSGRFFLSGGAAFRVELKDSLGLPGDQFEDGLFTAMVEQAVSDEIPVTLSHVKNGETQVLWEGAVVPLDRRQDRITFRVDEDGQARPHLRALEIFSPEVRHRGGKIIGLAWLASLVMMGLWWARFGRQGAH